MSLHVNEQNFQKEVLQSRIPVLVDFWASWCRPCRDLAPTLDSIGESRSDIKVAKIDIEENQNLAAEYRIQSIPVLYIFMDGKEIGRASCRERV